jgi:hypothetical protein
MRGHTHSLTRALINLHLVSRMKGNVTLDNTLSPKIARSPASDVTLRNSHTCDWLALASVMQRLAHTNCVVRQII